MGNVGYRRRSKPAATEESGVGSAEHRRRSTSIATRMSGTKRCPDEISVSLDEVAGGGTLSSGRASGEAPVSRIEP